MMIKRYVALMIILLLAIPAIAQDTSSDSRESIRVNFEGVEFVLPAALAGEIDLHINPEQILEEGMPGWTVFPETLEITLDAYGDDIDYFHTPQLRFFKLDNDMSRFGEEDYHFPAVVSQLKMLLTEQPPAENFVGNDFSDELPLLPIFNANQVFRAKVQYLASEHITGIRYLTYYAQGAAPVMDTDIFYTFQGISNDGSYYISAILPLASGQLPEIDTTADDFDYATFSENIMSYMAETSALLHELDDDTYTPTLATLDDLLLSIQMMPSEDN